jgi:hypothetical protein
MTHTKDEALKLALEALEGIHPGNMTPMTEEYWNKAITAIKQALAAPVQEPVAWMDKYGEIYKDVTEVLSTDTPLYTTPPAAQPAVPDAITDNSESLEYRTGWNDCRAEMLKGMK